MRLSQAGEGAADDRVRASMTRWRQRLLDLTKRNRALNFKATKVSTVSIVDELPAQVFQRLVTDAKAFGFRAMLPSKEGAPDDLQEDDAEVDVEGEAFNPDTSRQLPEHQTDDVLQAMATPEALDKSLRRL